MESYQYKLLIGGIGDDAHSIGIGLLELGFREAGFFVKSLGIRNTLSSFFQHAKDFDIILISNKNGHAELYLNDFPGMLSTYNLTDDNTKLWYLGGSLSVSESDFHVKKKYLNMGFTNVYPKPILFHRVLEDINQDIHRYGIRRKYVMSREVLQKRYVPPVEYDKIVDRKWKYEELQAQRKTVLQEWPTGEHILEKRLPPFRSGLSLDQVLWENKQSGGIPLFQPRTGVADINEQIGLLKYLEVAGSDISSVQLDAASRGRDYKKALLGREISLERKNSMLNGFPIPTYTVEQIREMVGSLKTPFQLRGGGPDHRFTYEIALNGGVSAVEGGFICYLLPYDKLCSPVTALNNWQYIDRLCALYSQEHGVHVNREYFGVLTATLIEPSLAIVVNIIQSLMSAQQGIKSITLGYAEQGNRSQDIAALQVLAELAAFYLKRYKFFDCRVTTVFHQFMAAFPSDYQRAESLIFNSSITATLAGANKVMVKTAVESINIPDRVENGKAINICKKAARHARMAAVNYNAIQLEKYYLRKEVKQIMNAIFELGNNSVALGAVKAIEEGIIDIPWSPNIYNANKVMGVRDVDGAIRFLNFGNIPFDEEVKSFHHQKVELRKMMERDSSVFSLLEKDLSRIWKNDYKQWPLDNSYIY